MQEKMQERRQERGPRAANLIGAVTGTKALETKAKAKTRARVKPDTATSAESKGISE